MRFFFSGVEKMSRIITENNIERIKRMLKELGRLREQVALETKKVIEERDVAEKVGDYKKVDELNKLLKLITG